MAGLRQLGNASTHWREFDFLEYCDDVRAAEPPNEAHSEAVDRLDALAKTIETEIVPRLMLAHKAELRREDTADSLSVEPGRDDVVDFAAVVLEGDMKAAFEFIDGLRARGVPLDSIYMDLLAPAARHLGELWLQDRCDFMAVTLGLSRMQQLLSALSTAAASERPVEEYRGRALLVTLPKEQHTFGLYMVAEFFRRDGWDVWGGVPESTNAILEFVMGDRFDVIGLSVSHENSMSRVKEVIRGVKRSSRNRNIGVLLGGSAVDGREDMVGDLGADAVAINGHLAVRRAQEIVSRLNCRLS